MPRGCLTEIIGAASSGRTSLLISILAAATAREETCALIDAEDPAIEPLLEDLHSSMAQLRAAGGKRAAALVLGRRV